MRRKGHHEPTHRRACHRGVVYGVLVGNRRIRRRDEHRKMKLLTDERTFAARLLDRRTMKPEVLDITLVPAVARSIPTERQRGCARSIPASDPR
jgi:hypothetical protein